MKINKKVLGLVIAGIIVLCVACNKDSAKQGYEDATKSTSNTQEQQVEELEDTYTQNDMDVAESIIKDDVSSNWDGRYKIITKENVICVYLDMDYTVLADAKTNPDGWEEVKNQVIRISKGYKESIDGQGCTDIGVSVMLGDIDYDKVYLGTLNDTLIYDVLNDENSNL